MDQTAASEAALAKLIEKYEKEWAYNVTYALAFRDEADRAFEGGILTPRRRPASHPPP